MPTLLTYLLLLLLVLFLAGVVMSRDGVLDSLARLRGKGTTITLGAILLFLVGALFYRTTFSMTDETERRITRGIEPGDTISLGYNTKARFRSLTQPLGRVFDRNGFTLAGYDILEGHLRRTYPAAQVTAHLVGYWTGPIRDGSGVEKGLIFLNDSLRDNRPHDVSLSLDLRLQNEGLRALRGRAGAVVVLDPSSGEVLAAASNPTFDPNTVWNDDDWTALATSKIEKPLLGRAVKDNFSPGSSVKPLIAAAALELDAPLPEEKGFVCRGEYDPGKGIPPISDHGAVHGKVDLARAMRVSCNTYFAHLAYELIGFDRLRVYLDSLGFNQRLSWNTGLFLNDNGALRLAPSWVRGQDPIARSRIGIGQASIRMNPIHAATVFGGIAKGGIFIRPSLEANRPPDTLGWNMSAASAERIAKLMLEPMKEGGTATGIFGGLERRGIKVYGKTGTADREPDGRAPAWFSSFGEKNGKVYVVIAVMEDRGSQYAAGVAAPIAQAMYEALEQYGYFSGGERSVRRNSDT